MEEADCSWGIIMHFEITFSNGTYGSINRIINTQYVTNPTIVYPVKMEYGWNFSISGLKMMVKSGLQKIFLKFLHSQAIFYEMNLTHRKEEFWSKRQIQ